MILNEPPKYCIECGRKMKPLMSVSYEPMTGEKIVEGPFVYQCSDGLCSHFAAVQTDGKWRT